MTWKGGCTTGRRKRSKGAAQDLSKKPGSSLFSLSTGSSGTRAGEEREETKIMKERQVKKGTLGASPSGK